MRNRFLSNALCSLALILTVVVSARSTAATDQFEWSNAVSGGDEWIASNDAHGFTARLSPEGLLVESADRTWNLRLILTRVGREGNLKAVRRGNPNAEGSRAEIHRGEIVEWFQNTKTGIEHGFTVAERPRGEGQVVLEVDLGDDLLAVPEPGTRSVALIRPGNRLAVLHYGGLKVFDALGRDVAAQLDLAAADRDRLRITVDDGEALYPLTVDPLLTSSSWTSTESDITTSVAWGDWDGDGDLDLAVGNRNQEANRVYENVEGTLSLAWTSAETEDTYSVAWGDWDGDGDLDLAVGNWSQPNRIYANTGGALSSAWISAESDYTFSVAWGDWDNDGDLDLAAGNGGANRVYENSGGALSSVWTSTDNDDTQSLAWGDWDGDGDLDLAAGNYFEPDRVYRNTGGGFNTGWTSFEIDDPTSCVAWGDWDGDGNLELAAGKVDGTIRVYAAGSLVWVSPQMSANTTSVAWGDWDGDGDLDLAAGIFNGFNRVFENSGGDLSTAWISAERADTYSVAWGDWDGDGDLDLATGNDLGNLVYENIGGALAISWASTHNDDTESAAWGDWDGDGDLDLAVGNADGPNRVYENSGGELSLAWTSTDIDDTYGVAWGDWDGDGDLDLAVANKNQPNRVYENSGGALSLVWTSADSDATWDVAWGDWDGDGDLDLAAGNWSQPNRIYENTGGALSSVWTSADTDNTVSLAWGDWDGDGDLDLAAGNYGDAESVYENSGGVLSLVWTSSHTGSYTSDVAWGDWDGDEDLDLAVAVSGGFNPDGFYVYENNGSTLDLAWGSYGNDPTTCVAWGDWDGDGDLDIAAGNYSRANFVYENTGGALSLAWTSADSDNTSEVAWGDWDGDGDLDLVAGNHGQVNRVYENGNLNRPGGLPESPVSPVIAGRPGLITTDIAFFFSAARMLYFPIYVWFELVDDDSDPARLIVPEYSLVEGGRWYPATEAPGGTGTTNLRSQPGGWSHLFVWNNLADGVYLSDSVRFRISVPYQASTRVAGPIQRAAMTAVSPPFRILDSVEADLSITKDDGQEQFIPGDSLTYTLTVSNAGPGGVVGAAVNDSFPAAITGITWICEGIGGGNCTNSSGAGDIAESVDLPTGAVVVFTATGIVAPSYPGPTLDNTATVACPLGVAELSPADNEATDSNTVRASIFADGFESNDTSAWSVVVP